MRGPRAARRLRHWGWRHACPICRARLSRFEPALGRRGARCPICGSLERHRHLWLYLRARTDLGARPLSLLHVSPDPALERALMDQPQVRYVSGDLLEGRGQRRLDLTALPFGPAQFDLVLAVHVLEHIPDDSAALREVARVLKPSGAGILQVPWRHGRTVEDPGVRTREERRAWFGQEDHVRWYGDADFCERARRAGLTCELEVFRDELPPPERHRFGLGYDVDDPQDDLLWTVARVSPAR